MKINKDIFSFQLPVFFTNKIQVGFDEISVELKKLDLFREPVVSITPIPPQVIDLVDANIPMLTVREPDNSVVVTFSFLRCDIYLNETLLNSLDNYEKKKAKVLEISDKFVGFINNKKNKLPSVGRVGCVSNHLITNVAVEKIVGLLNLNLTERNVIEVSLRFNIRENLNGYYINNIYKIDPAVKIETGEKGLIIQRDINTIAEQTDTNTFDQDFVKNFITSSFAKVEEDEIFKELELR